MKNIRALVTSAPLVALAAGATPAHAETRGYVISWFGTATHVTDFKNSCPQNKNGGGAEWMIRDLISIGYSRAQAAKLAEGGEVAGPLRDKLAKRAVVNGKNVSIYNYPDAVPDPDIETVSGKYAYGFDLGGTNEAAKFIDPDTGGKVDNQLWRAIGCTASFRAEPPAMPFPEEVSWNAMVETSPGWSMRITAEDFSKDGKVTLTLDRVTQHLERDAAGNIMSSASYVIEPSEKSHNVLKGELKGGVITIEPQDIYLQAEMPFYPEMALRNAHMRITVKPDGQLVGYWGGYFSRERFSYMITSRPGHGGDSLGIYHAVKKMADASPDPKTGQNEEISSTWRMEAVPAFLTTIDGKVVANAVLPAAAPAQVAAAADSEG
ncbi:hypothetical protein [Steroidobacter cummioxidans]|uniref:hypothetical protein n=1 Tax=Steroidobacter cummioxidans TaxID=1803913 RepID=UPI000E313022|nr:hypothetical protein [Steroidobacter cummioxidans]